MLSKDKNLQSSQYILRLLTTQSSITSHLSVDFFFFHKFGSRYQKGLLFTAEHRQ